MQITTIGLDLAKNTFHVVGLNQANTVVMKKKLRRNQVLDYFSRLSNCIVAMEACGGAHYFGRELEKQGHCVKLIPPKYVKPYVQGNKNDYNDALAIAEAAKRPKMRLVKIKSMEQQDLQSLHRLREALVRQRTRTCNQIRGLLAEYGITIPKGISRVRTCIPRILEDAENGLTSTFRQLLSQTYQHLQRLDTDIKNYDQQLQAIAKTDKAAQQLQTIPGYGPVVSSVFLSVMGDGQAFKRGRDVGAYLGLVPRQHSSGDKPVLLGISKRGNRYLRGLLIHGARSVIRVAANKEDRLSRWAMKLVERRGKNKATVALANKLARIGWAVLTQDTVYQARYA